MRMNEQMGQTWGAGVGMLALLALLAGTALATTPNTTAYHFSSHPMISGTVVSVNDHQMVVNTDQGEQVLLEVDTRTSAPRDLAPGMVMRADFLALDDCRFYAQRITPIRDGAYTNRMQAYANTRDSREAVERSAGYSGGYRHVIDARPARADGWQNVPQTVGEHSPGTIPNATATTADNHFSTRPMMSGTVISVNDHRVVVETDQGQMVGLVMDSRTMVPSELAPGAILRADFQPMKDGRYYARRISQIGSTVASREQAYAYTHDSDYLLAQNNSDCGFVSAAAPTAVVEPAATSAPVAVQAEPVVETLPQTASNQPLTLLFGLFALGSAGLVMVVRRLRMA